MFIQIQCAAEHKQRAEAVCKSNANGFIWIKVEQPDEFGTPNEITSESVLGTMHTFTTGSVWLAEHQMTEMADII